MNGRRGAARLVVAAAGGILLGLGLARTPHGAPLAPQRTSSTSMPSYCEGQVRVFPGLGVAYDPTCMAPAP